MDILESNRSDALQASANKATRDCVRLAIDEMINLIAQNSRP